MAVLSKTQYKTLYGSTGSVFPDNTTEDISEADMRQFGEDTADSFNSVLESNTVESWKSPCAVATTANITLSGEQTIDGVLTSASRVLVKNQTTTSQNGIYVSAAGAWSRSTDADAAAELEGAAVGVTQGTTQQNTVWLQTSDNITLGSTAIAWQQIGFGFSGISGSTGATDNAILRADGTGGSTLQASTPTISDAGRISNVTDPSSAQDAATKAYVDGLLAASMQVSTTTVNSSQISNMFSSPVELIAAPGANKIIVMHSMIVQYIFVTTAYTSNTDVAIRYDGNTTNMYFATAQLASASSNYAVRLPQNVSVTSPSELRNKSVLLTEDTGNPSGGDSTLKIIITYSIIDFT